MNEAYGKADTARRWLRTVLVLDGFVLCFTLCSAANNNGGLSWLLLLVLAGITGLALWYATKNGYWFVRRVERTWKQTCAGLGGNFVGEQNDYLASIREGIRSHGQYYVATQKKVAYPVLKNICGNWESFTAEIRFISGQALDDYKNAANAFELAFQVPVTFDIAESGLIRMRAGKVSVPAAYDFEVQ